MKRVTDAMSRRQSTWGWIALVLTVFAAVIANRVVGWQFALAVIAVAWVVQFGLGWWLGSRAAGRLEQRVLDLVDADLVEREKQLAQLDPDDAATARLWLGDIKAAHEDPRAATPRVFRYPSTPNTLFRVQFYLCAGMALLPTLLLLTGHVQRAQRTAALLVAMGFTAFALLAILARKLKTHQLRIGAFGIVETNALGRRRMIAWSAVDNIEDGVGGSLVVNGRDGARSLRVWPTLEGFPQFVEAIASEHRRLVAIGQIAPPETPRESRSGGGST